MQCVLLFNLNEYKYRPLNRNLRRNVFGCSYMDRVLWLLAFAALKQAGLVEFIEANIIGISLIKLFQLFSESTPVFNQERTNDVGAVQT